MSIPRGFAKSLYGIVGAPGRCREGDSRVAGARSRRTGARQARLPAAIVTRIEFSTRQLQREQPAGLPRSNMVVLVDTDAGIRASARRVP